MGIRIFASRMVLTKASGYANLLAPLDLRTCLGSSGALLRSISRGGPAQIDPPALEAQLTTSVGSHLGQDDPPLISALVCTCGRGALVVDTVLSILANMHPNFELIVVDQSKDNETLEALKPFGTDPRLRYVKIATIGKGNVLNAGLTETKARSSQSPMMIVRSRRIGSRILTQSSPHTRRLRLLFVASRPASTTSFIPDYVLNGERMLTTMHDARHVRGLGAGIAVRRKMVEEIGRFDPMLGPGSRFPSCDDRDIAMRALLAGYHVYEASTIAVKHFGFRNWQQGRQLAHRDFLVIGAPYSKFLKCGRVNLMCIPAHEFIKYALWPLIRDLLHLRQPRGIVRITAFVEGFIGGLQTPVDRATMLFVEGQQK